VTDLRLASLFFRRLADNRPLAAVTAAVASRFPDPCVVGGALRDLSFNRPLTDVDITVGADPAAVASEIAREFSLGYALLDAERGIVRLAGNTPPRFTVDIAGRVGESVETDLARRDFTVNAVALSLTDERVVDPFGGLSDLAAGRLAPVSPTVFTDDPARIVRLYRFMATHRLIPDEALRRAAARSAPLLDTVAPERLWQETVRLFERDAASHAAVTAMADDRILDRLFPELVACRGVTQNRWHHLDVFDHSLATLAALESIALDGEPFAPFREKIEGALAEEIAFGVETGALLKLAALLHDVGKPSTRTVDRSGRIRFLTHETVGARMAEEGLRRRFKAPGKCIAAVGRLIGNHLRPFNAIADGTVSDRAVYRYVKAVGDLLAPASLMAVADAAATCGPAVTPERRIEEFRAVGTILGSVAPAASPPPRLLTGDDLMRELGLPPGPDVGKLLGAIDEATALGEIAAVDEALALARSLRGA
jgi:putative nucleotidyltransferase with HDIG domain